MRPLLWLFPAASVASRDGKRRLDDHYVPIPTNNSPRDGTKSARVDSCTLIHPSSFCDDVTCDGLFWLNEEMGSFAYFTSEEYDLHFEWIFSPVMCNDAETRLLTLTHFDISLYTEIRDEMGNLLDEHVLPSLLRFPMDTMNDDTQIMVAITRLTELLDIHADRSHEAIAAHNYIAMDPTTHEVSLLVEHIATSVAYIVPRKAEYLMRKLFYFCKLVTDIKAIQSRPNSSYHTDVIMLLYFPVFRGAVSATSWFQRTNQALTNADYRQGFLNSANVIDLIGGEGQRLADCIRTGTQFHFGSIEARAADINRFSEVVREIASSEDSFLSNREHDLFGIWLSFNEKICSRIAAVVEYLISILHMSRFLLVPTLLDLCRSSVQSKMAVSAIVNRFYPHPVSNEVPQFTVPSQPLDAMVQESLSILGNPLRRFNKDRSVVYRDNPNVGYIGQRKQWLSDMIAEVFKVREGDLFSAFAYSDESRSHIVLRGDAEGNVDLRGRFLAVGRLIGLAIKHEVPMGVHFAPSFVKLLRSVSSAPNPEEYDAMLEVTDPAFLAGTRSITPDLLSEHPDLFTFDGLGGYQGPVSEDNLSLFQQVSKEAKLFHSQSSAMRMVRVGVVEVLGPIVLNTFTEEEFRERLYPRDIPISPEELWNGMIFRNFREDNEFDVRVKADFRAFLFSLPAEYLAKFHSFVSGVPRLPLNTVNPWIKVFLETSLGANSLPRSHTCHNELQVPPYGNREALFEKFTMAISEGVTIEGHADYRVRLVQDA